MINNLPIGLNILIVLFLFLLGLAVGRLLINRRKKASNTFSEQTILQGHSSLDETADLQRRITIKESESAKYRSLLEHSQQTVSSLRKQLEENETNNINLHDRIENLEYDLGLLNEKLGQRKNIISELEDEIDKYDRDNIKLLNDYRVLERDFQSTKSELGQKNESLDFVAAILQAESSSDGNLLDSSVRRIKGFIAEDINSILKTLKEEEIDREKINSWSLSANKFWLNGKLSIAFVGAFSSGKTSIINRILSNSNPNSFQLPVDVVPTTAIPTYITSCKSDSSFQFYTPNNLLKNISEDLLQKIDKDILSNIKGVSSLIKYFVLKSADLNFEKLSILDTPGFFSNDLEDERRTLDAIGESDAIFWVIDINNGQIDGKSLEKLHDFKNLITKPLYVVINKVDLVSNSTQNDITCYIQQQCEQDNINVERFIPFSQELPIDIILDSINNIKANNQKSDFLMEVLNILIDVSSKQTDIVNKKIKVWENLAQEKKQCIESYRRIQAETKTLCGEARNIPNFHSPFIGHDRYQMSPDTFSRLTSKLDLISIDQMEKLKSKFDESNELENKLSQALNDLNSSKYAFIKMKSLIGKFKILVSEYKRITN